MLEHMTSTQVSADAMAQTQSHFKALLAAAI
jgi:hypothetical protein